MAIYIGDKEINGWYLGDKQVEGVYLGDTLIWPTSYRYVITAINILYSAGSQIYASASNYAYATGTVQVWRGRTLVETRTNQPLTPSALASGDTTHFRIDGANVKGYNLGTTSVTRNYSVAVSWTYRTSQAVTATTQITQQTNAPGQYSITNVSLGLSGYDILCNENTLTLYGSITRYKTRTWTSGATETATDNDGSIDIYYGGSKVQSITHEGSYTPTVGYNYYNTNKRYFTYTARYNNAYDTSKTIEQTNDSVISTDTVNVAGSFWASLTADGNITARGGDRINLTATAGHQYKYRYAWRFGPDYTYSDPIATSDGATIYTTSETARVSRSGSVVTHSNMGKNVTTDRGVYYCTNNSDYSVTDSVTLSASNARHQNGNPYDVPGQKVPGTSYPEYQNWTASLVLNRYTSSSSKCPASGGTSNITTCSANHQQRTATPWTQHIDIYAPYIYDSGVSDDEKSGERTDSGTDRTSWTTVTDSVTPSVSGDGFSLSGNTVTIASEGCIPYASGRTGTVSIDNGGHASASVTLYQDINEIVHEEPGSWSPKSYSNYTYRVSLSSSLGVLAFYDKTYADALTYSGEYDADWSRYRDIDCTWSSGTHSTRTQSDSGRDTGIDNTAEVTLTVETGSSYCSVSGRDVTMGIYLSTATRTATIVAHNHYATAPVTIEQRGSATYGIDFTAINNVIYAVNIYKQALQVDVIFRTYRAGGGLSAEVEKNLPAATSGENGVQQTTNFQLGFQPGGSFEVYRIVSVTPIE